MEGENVILEEILHKIHEIKIGDYVDASDFLLKILSPTKPGEQDLLEDLRAGFRNRVIEPCFSKLEDIFQDLEKRHQSKDSQIYQLMDPLKSSDFQKYQQQVAKVLDQNLKTLKYPTASPIVSKILADPLNLVELSGLYQKKAKAVFDKQLDGLNTTIEIPKDSVQSAADTVSLGKNAKDVVPVAKNPIVNSSLENIPAEKQQADLNANNSWSIGAANNLLEKPVQEKQQANLEADAIEVTLSEKSLKDLKELIIRGEESAKLFAPKNSQENVTQDSGVDSGLSIKDALLAAAVASKKLLRLGGIVYVGYEAIKAMKEKIARLNADTDAAFESAKAYGLRKESLPENKKWALDYYNSLKEQKGKSVVSTGMTSEYEASKRAAELPGPEGDAARADILYRDNFEPEKSKSVVPAGTATIPIKTDDDIIAKLKEKMVELEQDRNFSASKMTGWLNTLITSSLKEELQKSIESQTERGNEIYNIIRQLKPTEPLLPGGSGEDRLPEDLSVNSQAQININGYKVVPPKLGGIESNKVFGKMDFEDMSKQFSKVLSPMFGRMYDILTSINDNTTGSGDNIVNNISSTDNSSSGNSGPMQSGRDPIADFRANYWRDSSSSTRYTS
jgi:hypothetical protein